MDDAVGVRAYALVFLSTLLLWILLTGSLATEELGAGLLVASVVSAVSGPHLAIFNGLKLHPLALLSLMNYLVYFFFALIRANLDMARRILSPSLPINPGVVEVETALASPLGRMLLANSITLTPGTLTVDLNQDRLLVHWINVPEDVDITRATQHIAAGFEQRISGFLK
jgi:multicomponent Na+:H+ antiporter subunit E